MSDANYSQLFADALADVESGVQHPCGTEQYCREMGGCPRCFRGLMCGEIGIEHIEVFSHSGVIRIITAGHEDRPCVVSFRGVPVTIKGKHVTHRDPSTPEQSDKCNPADARRLVGPEQCH